MKIKALQSHAFLKFTVYIPSNLHSLLHTLISHTLISKESTIKVFQISYWCNGHSKTNIYNNSQNFLRKNVVLVAAVSTSTITKLIFGYYHSLDLGNKKITTKSLFSQPKSYLCFKACVYMVFIYCNMLL